MKLDDLDYIILKKIQDRINKYRLLYSKKELLEKEIEVIQVIKKDICNIEKDINEIDNKICTLARGNIGENK